MGRKSLEPTCAAGEETTRHRQDQREQLSILSLWVQS